jgi:predicted Zn-dependent protease
MRFCRLPFIAALCAALLPAQNQPAAQDDALLRAMRAESARALELRVVSLEPPYFIEYTVHDALQFAASATLGALTDARQERARLPRIRVRVGSYEFDNGNYIYSDSVVTRYSLGPLTVDDNELAMRHYFWLATDAYYKAALQVMARKQAALRNLTVSSQGPDFARAAPVSIVLGLKPQRIDQEAWKKLVRDLSALFTSHPGVLASVVEFKGNQGAFYLVNTEGSSVRVPENAAHFEVRAAAMAPDGMVLRDWAAAMAGDVSDLPSETELRRITEEVAYNLEALSKAPRGERYTGPVLFEPTAAAQLMADVFGRNLGLRRRPVSEPGRVISFAESEFEGRLGARILPDWIDITDDPTLKEWNGRRLFGNYLVDLDGVVPAPLSIVEKGVLKNMLATRQPLKDRTESNGRARLFGNFGANAPAFGNLIVHANNSTTLPELKRRLIELSQQRNAPYALLVRKMDFPSTASTAEYQRIAARTAADGGPGRSLSLPLLVYRVYPDGREELVRGLRIKGAAVRSLRDIVAAGGDPVVFDYQENGWPFAIAGGASFVAECSVVSPGLLFEELQLEALEEEYPTPPIVPPPPLAASR